jgi:hypothetical protein
MALQQVIPLMGLLQEMKEHGVINKDYCPKVFYKAFEDNSGALVLARAPRMRPRTCHINVKYHHFRQAVANKEIEIYPIDTEDQIADLWTKPLGSELFEKFTKLAMGWSIADTLDQYRNSMKQGSVE